MRNKVTNVSESKLLQLACGLMLVYFAPYFLLGENARIVIHDNLDSNFVWVKLLLLNDALLGEPQQIIPSVFEGLPVSSIYPYYDFSLLIFKVFGMYWGYSVNKILIAFIGFWGMFFLIKTYLKDVVTNSIIRVSTSLMFGLLPFWSFTATVAGLPFLVFTFLNLRSGDLRFLNWFIIILFSFYSSLFLSGIFIGGILMFLWLRDLIIKKKFNIPFFMGFVLFGFCSLISHYPVISAFVNGYESHRSEFYVEGLSILDSMKNSIKIFSLGQYHAHSLHTLILIPLLFLFFQKGNHGKVVKWILAFLLLTSLFYGFLNLSITKPIFDKIMSIVPLQLQRFHFIHPMLWYLLLAVVLQKLLEKGMKYNKVVILFIIIQLFAVSSQHEMITNSRRPSFKQFFAEGLFDEIKAEINQPESSYKVVSIGLHPSIAQYNGLYTLDGYFPRYPLSYKHKFKKVIEHELDRNKEVKDYFENWGSRCYAFSSELGKSYLFSKETEKKIERLEYDFEEFKKLGGKYLISSVPINAENIDNLNLIKSFEGHDSYWKLNLYIVD